MVLAQLQRTGNAAEKLRVPDLLKEARLALASLLNDRVKQGRWDAASPRPAPSRSVPDLTLSPH